MSIQHITDKVRFNYADFITSVKARLYKTDESINAFSFSRLVLVIELTTKHCWTHDRQIPFFSFEKAVDIGPFNKTSKLADKWVMEGRSAVEVLG